MEWSQVVAIVVAILIKEFATTIRNMWQSRKTDREEAFRSRILSETRRELQGELESLRTTQSFRFEA